jgi:hypothetical protein
LFRFAGDKLILGNTSNHTDLTNATLSNVRYKVKKIKVNSSCLTDYVLDGYNYLVLDRTVREYNFDGFIQIIEKYHIDDIEIIELYIACDNKVRIANTQIMGSCKIGLLLNKTENYYEVLKN